MASGNRHSPLPPAPFPQPSAPSAPSAYSLQGIATGSQPFCQHCLAPLPKTNSSPVRVQRQLARGAEPESGASGNSAPPANQAASRDIGWPPSPAGWIPGMRRSFNPGNGIETSKPSSAACAASLFLSRPASVGRSPRPAAKRAIRLPV